MFLLEKEGKRSRERMLAALRLEEPRDRVPVLPWVVPRIFQDVYKISWSREIYHVMMLRMGFDPYIGVGLGGPTVAKDVTVKKRIVAIEERGLVIERTFETPLGEIKESYFHSIAPEQSVAGEHLDINIGSYKEYLVKSKEDVERVRAIIPDPWERNTTDIREGLKTFKDIAVVVGGVSGPFNRAVRMRGYMQVVRDIYGGGDPSILKGLIDIFLKEGLKIIQIYGELGVDVLHIMSNFSSMSLISPRIFKEYIYPYESQFCKEAHKYDMIVRYHMDGRCSAALELLADMGVDQIETLDPPTIGGDITLSEAKKRVGNRMCLYGNIDPINVIKIRSPQEIMAEAKKCIDDAAPGGGFILGSADTIAPGTPPENLEALAKAARLYGRYR